MITGANFSLFFSNFGSVGIVGLSSTLSRKVKSENVGLNAREVLKVSTG
jgi:hypothetical protein